MMKFLDVEEQRELARTTGVEEAEVYDQVIALGASMIQTDRPEQLLDYLRKKGLHD